MMWGAFSASGCLDIQFTSSRMNSRDYIQVLEKSLIPFLREHPEKTWIFQQDNARIHTSRETMTWMENNSINVMKWPACSPDLNPIENIWGILVRRVYAGNRQYDSTNHLKEAIVKEWRQLDKELIKNLINSLKKRIIGVIKLKGGPINF